MRSFTLQSFQSYQIFYPFRGNAVTVLLTFVIISGVCADPKCCLGSCPECDPNKQGCTKDYDGVDGDHWCGLTIVGDPTSAALTVTRQGVNNDKWFVQNRQKANSEPMGMACNWNPKALYGVCWCWGSAYCNNIALKDLQKQTFFDANGRILPKSPYTNLLDDTSRICDYKCTGDAFSPGPGTLPPTVAPGGGSGSDSGSGSGSGAGDGSGNAAADDARKKGNSTDAGKTSTSGSNLGAIIGAVVGLMVIFALVAGYFAYKKFKRGDESDEGGEGGEEGEEKTGEAVEEEEEA